MEKRLRDYVEDAEAKLGGRKKLASWIGVAANSLTDAKSERRGLPNYALLRISHLIGVDLQEIIAASELATEKDPEKRAFWLPFVRKVAELPAEIAGKKTVAAETKTAPENREPSKEEVVAKGGIEPPTRGFSIRCSTN